GKAGAFPEKVAGRNVVAANPACGAGDDLRPAGMLQHEWRGPGGALITRLAPQLLAGLRVQGDDEVVSFMVPVDDDRVPVKRGRTAFAEAQGDAHIAKILAPLELSGHIVAIQPARAEISEDMLPIGDAGRRGEAAFILAITFVRDFLAGGLPPKHLAGSAVEAENHKLIDFIGLLPAAEATAATTARLILRWRICSGIGLLCLGFFAGGNRGLDKHLVLPDQRRGRAIAGDPDLPLHVVRFAPRKRRVGLRSDTVGKRPAPLRPVLPGRTRGRVRSPRAGQQY